MTRGLRRHHIERLRAKASAIFRGWRRTGPPYLKLWRSDGRIEWMEPADLARALSIIVGTHGRACSCFYCRRGTPIGRRSARVIELGDIN